MKGLEAFALSILAVFAPIKAVILTVLVLITVDLITGIMAAKKRGEPITSAGFRRTVAKCLVYESALMLGFLTEHYLTGAAIPVSKIVSSFIGITELRSALENLNDVSGGSLLQALLAKLQSVNTPPPPPPPAT